MSATLDRPIRGHAALRRCRTSLPGHVYHVTTATHGRLPIFAEFATARATIRAFHAAGLLRDSELLAWVLMPDHLHVLLRLGEHDALGGLVCRLKSASSRAANQCLKRSGPVWQKAYHDHVLRRDEDVVTVGRYIVANPLRAGLVSRLGCYSHWDAIWL